MAPILIVEDEDQIRVLAESILEGAGHRTLSAADPEKAMALLARDTEIDLLFTDLGLDGDNHAGIATAQRAVEMRPGLPVVYTTGQAVTDGMQAMFVEPSELIPKPYRAEQLIETVDRMLRRKDTPTP